MAHLEAYTRRDMTKITREAYREHTNQSAYKNNVDLSKSHLNYSMMGIDRKEFLSRLDARCVAVMQGKKMQSQTKVIGSWVFTVPEEISGDTTKEKMYFDSCFEFAQERYGKENVIDGVVHYDEGTPHMTVYTVPVTKSRKTGDMTISKASLFTKTELERFHPALDEKLEDVFGQKGLALNGRTKGNYTLEELKERTKREEDIKARLDEVETREAELIPRIKRNNKNREAIAKKQKEQDAREARLQAQEAALASERENMRREVERRLKTQSDALQREKEAFEEEKARMSATYKGKLQQLNDALESIKKYPAVRSDALVFESERLKNGKVIPKRKYNAMGVVMRDTEGNAIRADARPLTDVVKDKNALHDKLERMKKEFMNSPLPWEREDTDDYTL